MKRPISLIAIVAVSLIQGCAVPIRPAASVLPNNNAKGIPEAALCGPANSSACTAPIASATNPVSAVTLCTAAEGCTRKAQAIDGGAEIGSEKNAPVVEGHPLTSVVVTQCNMVVAVYMTMPDGRFLRFDRKANVPAEQLVATAYTATRSERVEVSCDGIGVAGYETHGPV